MARRANGEGSIYKLPNGKWRVSVTIRENGVQRRVYRVCAKRHLAVDKLAELRGNPPEQAAAGTMEEVIRSWLRMHVDRKTSANTQSTYHASAEKHVIPRVGKLKIAKFSPRQVEEFLIAMETDAVGPRAAQMAFQTLRAAMSYAVHPLGVIPRNPCSLISKPSHERKAIQPFELDQMKEILAVANGGRWHAMLTLAFGCGLRFGELAGLHWEQVDFEAKRITIDRQLRDVRGVREMAKPKTSSGVRDVALPVAAINALREHRALMMKEGLAGCAIVFPNTIGGFLCRANWSKEVWTPLLASLEIPQRGIHHARHTFATFCLSKGDPIADVAKALGHASGATTMRTYSHALKSNARATADTMDRMLG